MTAPNEAEVEPCIVCGLAECIGPAIHQIRAVLGAYRMSHQRGEHKQFPPSLCPLCRDGEGDGCRCGINPDAFCPVHEWRGVS